MERWSTETHCLCFHCETFSFPYYLSTRNCLFQYFYIYMFISEGSVEYSHLISAAVRGVIHKRTKAVI